MTFPDGLVFCVSSFAILPHFLYDQIPRQDQETKVSYTQTTRQNQSMHANTSLSSSALRRLLRGAPAKSSTALSYALRAMSKAVSNIAHAPTLCSRFVLRFQVFALHDSAPARSAGNCSYNSFQHLHIFYTVSCKRINAQ